MTLHRRVSAFVAATCITLWMCVAHAQTPNQHGPKVLVVDAHPDDEGAYAATIYKLTHDLHGTVDLAVITNGEGGYKYSTLAEAYYGLELTDEKIGRENLPRIRKQELMNAGKILGVRNYFFLDQRDNHYTLNPHEVLDSVWNVPMVEQRLHELLIVGRYDYLFCVMPYDSTHGHHKAATILALRAVAALDASNRPIILAGGLGYADSTKRFVRLNDYPITEIDTAKPVLTFDRGVHFGYHNVLTYKMIVDWATMEHKSQGTLRPLGPNDNTEWFYFFKLNDPSRYAQAQELFRQLAVLHFVTKTY